ncbi:DUF1178 family protein [Fulvimarina sp. MAC8]|uniref:DUF1178 family protein n=1 Tax=Fulvimarina sp. MAC8 TaxID=3162874 RepID=UPI0032F03372
MIHFALKCCDGHRFDGWFRSTSDFETQLSRGLVTCTYCGETNVEKALMRPAIGLNAKTDASKEASDTQSESTSGSVTTVAAETPPDQNLAKMKELWSALQTEVRALRKKSEYVGTKFAEEARRVHYGESTKKGVYGEASREEVKALHEEGIMAFPMPALPEDKN